YDEFDYIIGMDDENMYYMKRIAGGDPEGKIHLLLEYAGLNRDIADPWYTGNFDETYEDLKLGLNAFAKEIGL
ncbi:MAG: low molecular weight phosphotyrosine protein phosphatase, partial [Lachnospiraceae bacterium]|nr:low molecular weight phosphotyrosine protein phosphatase [Lachnospiraceae bacterium]